MTWVFWHELWVEWPYSQDNLCIIKENCRNIESSMRNGFLWFKWNKMGHFSALHSVPYVPAFCLECNVLYQEIQRHASVTNCSTLFLFFLPPLKFELNREGERDWFLFCSHFCSGQNINSQHSGDASGEPQGEHMMFLFLKRWQACFL